MKDNVHTETRSVTLIVRIVPSHPADFMRATVLAPKYWFWFHKSFLNHASIRESRGGWTLVTRAKKPVLTLKKRVIKATGVFGAQLRITFRRIPFQQVQTELRKGCFLVGKQIETWTKKAAFSTVLNAVSSFKHVSARAGTVIHTRIKAALVSGSTPPVLGIDVEKPNSSERL